MSNGLDLKVTACRARYRAAGRLSFPAQAANALRGVMGFALDESVFRPVLGSGPSGLMSPPRPFVIHAGHLDGAVIDAGGCFEVGLSLFYAEPGQFKRALEKLDSWSAGSAELLSFDCEEQTIDLGARVEAPGRIRVLFETPTELKGHDGAGPPQFAVLMSRLRDRVGALRALYGPGPLGLDFKAFQDAADRVRTAGGAVEHRQGKRRSGRTGQTHPLSGFTGWAEYEGDFRSYLPFLEAAAHTCVGRQTVWGHGRLRVEAC